MENHTDSGAVLGIDVGYSARKATTGLCLLLWTEANIEIRFDQATSDELDRIRKLKTLAGGSKLLCAAIDGSLVPGLKITNRYRPAEALLSRGKFARRGKPAPTSNPLGQAVHREATAIARLTLSTLDIAPADYPHRIHEKAIIEAFPNAFLAVLYPDEDFPTPEEARRRWTDVLFPHLTPQLAKMLQGMLPHRYFALSHIRGHEDIAAFVCALTALATTFGQAVALGDSELGYIVLPPLKFWAKKKDGSTRWAEEALKNNFPRIIADFGNAEIYKDNRLWLAPQPLVFKEDRQPDAPSGKRLKQ